MKLHHSLHLCQLNFDPPKWDLSISLQYVQFHNYWLWNTVLFEKTLSVMSFLLKILCDTWTFSVITYPHVVWWLFLFCRTKQNILRIFFLSIQWKYSGILWTVKTISAQYKTNEINAHEVGQIYRVWKNLKLNIYIDHFVCWLQILVYWPSRQSHIWQPIFRFWWIKIQFQLPVLKLLNLVFPNIY